MLIALAFLSFITGLITLSIQNDKDRLSISQARSVAWQVSTVSKAARVYVRNNAITGEVNDLNGDGAPDNAFANLAGAIIEIAPRDLATNAGLLPISAFPQNPADSLETLYGQQIRIFVAPFPLTDPNGIPSAYIYLEPSALSNAPRMQDVAFSMQEFGTSMNAPLFDSDGNNLSPFCGVDRLVSSWGPEVQVGSCINATDFLNFGVGAFQSGALLVPTWRSQEFRESDLFAMSRFQARDGIGTNIMSTDLKFGFEDLDLATGDCNSFVQIYDSVTDTMVDSTICNVSDDDNTAFNAADGVNQQELINSDRRVNIVNLNSLSAQKVILSNQPAGAELSYNYNSATQENDDANMLALQGLGGSLQTDGDVLITNRLNPNPARFGNLDIDHNIQVSGDLRANDISVEDADISGQVQGNDFYGSGTVYTRGNIGIGRLSLVGGQPGLKVQGDLDLTVATSATTPRLESLDIGSNMTLDTLLINGTGTVPQGQFGTLFAIVNDSINSDLIVGNSLTSIGTVFTTGDTTIGQCTDDPARGLICPEIRQCGGDVNQPVCPN